MEVDPQGLPDVVRRPRLELAESRNAHLPRNPVRPIEFFYWENLRAKLTALPMKVAELDQRVSELQYAPAAQRIQTVSAIKGELEKELAERQRDIDAQKSCCCGKPSPELLEAERRLSAARPLVARLQNVINEETMSGIPPAKPTPTPTQA